MLDRPLPLDNAPPLLLALLQLALGIAVLIGGGELLVRGASRLAAALGISPLVVGLTVVSFGTSAPELAVSLGAAFTPEASLVIGNVVGSNVFNTFVVLGTVAFIGPLVVQQRIVRLEVPLLVGISFLVWLIGDDGSIGRIDASVLLTLLGGYTVFLIRSGRRARDAIPTEYKAAYGSTPKASARQWVEVAVGSVLLVGGAKLVVSGAVDISRALGVSEMIIGLTVVAVGTSLPELVASGVAAVRGERDLAVGNVIGSNLFNLLAVLGITGVVAARALPIPDDAVIFDLPVMVATAVVCVPLVLARASIGRKEGVLLITAYVAYMTAVVMRALG